MSVIHDALEKGGKPAALAMRSFPVLLPDVIPHVSERRMNAQAFQKVSNYAADHPRIIYGLPLLLLLGVLVISGLRFSNVPAPDSSSKKRMPALSASGHPRPDVLPQKTRLSGSSGYQLTGIVEGAEGIAIINDQTLRVGDRIGRALVKEIQGRRVILEFQGREIILSLQEA